MIRDIKKGSFLDRSLNGTRTLIFFVLCFFYFLSGLAQSATFTNPLRDGADPWVFEKDGTYYYCAASENGIAVSRSDKLTDQGVMVKVWETPDEGWNQFNVWAPELHYIGGHWYIYYTAGAKKGSPFIYQRSGVLKSTTDHPFGPYEDKGMLYTGDNIKDKNTVKWAIDLTPFEHNGKLYAVWSGWEENRETDKTAKHLYMAEMSDPMTICSNRVRISSPEEAWETGGDLDLIEGPQILKHREKTFIIYSTRESWLKEYRLGQLWLENPSSDPMLPENWIKSGPVFQGSAQVYGVGHCSFAKSPDGTEDWILYHSKKSTKPGWNRDIRLQRFHWNEDGSPDFGTPVDPNEPLIIPSGEALL
ncbi:glycoside hydrolase family 43 protein [Anditalea andensis]|nr:glycoside hydrolase family 43 protein [Anditalea andensis]